MTLGSHQHSIGKSQVHITPKWIIDKLGPFDLDPCGNHVRPWDCARRTFVERDNGLSLPWHGFVWLNPPFHRYEVKRWIERMAVHDNGIALLHARTETDWFSLCWKKASCFLFMAQRIIFHKPDGSQQTTLNGDVANSGAPPVLVGFGAEAKRRLESSGIAGAFVTQWNYRA